MHTYTWMKSRKWFVVDLEWHPLSEYSVLERVSNSLRRLDAFEMAYCKKSCQYFSCLDFFHWGYTTVYLLFVNVKFLFFFFSVYLGGKVLSLCWEKMFTCVPYSTHTRHGDVTCVIIFSRCCAVFTTHTLSHTNTHTHSQACAGLMYGTNKTKPIATITTIMRK